jgi:oligoribonuclease NrnB/cAMP/cGMP phosphodiesterase (DHH superfamily)
MSRIIHLTANDFEGMACAVLSKYIFGDNITIKYIEPTPMPSNLNTALDALDTDNTSLLIVTVKGSPIVNSKYNLIQATSHKMFDEFYKKFEFMFPESFKGNSSLITFKENTRAYLDWTWKSKSLYLGKNIDDLSKSYDKEYLVSKIATRISQKQHVVTDAEKEILKFDKHKMTKYIESKKVSYLTTSNFSYGIIYGDQYNIETANVMLNKHSIEIAVVINMDTKLALFRCNTNKLSKDRIDKFKKLLEDVGGITQKSGGIIKFDSTFDQTIFTALINKI